MHGANTSGSDGVIAADGEGEAVLLDCGDDSIVDQANSSAD
jgi:hypothetical protein